MEDKELQRQQEIQAGNVNKEELPADDEVGEKQYEGTEGQDRESYTDDQDRESYMVEDGEEKHKEGHTLHPDTLADRAAFEGPISEQTPVPNRTLLRKPYRVEGGEVLDADGDRVASAGYNSNRKTTGPAIALLIAEALNRY